MLGMRKEYSLENGRLRITRMARIVDGRKEYRHENGRLRITRMARRVDGAKEYSLKNVRLRITRMERMWATRILVWGYLGDYAPPPKGGAWSPRYPYKKDVGLMLSLIHIYNGWNALWTLYAGGVLWARTVRQKAPWTLCALWEKNLSTHTYNVFSHRITQNNRTHQGSQRH